MARGVRLALAARRQDLLDRLADQIASSGRPRPIVIPTDLSEPGAATVLGRDAVDALVDTLGALEFATHA